MNDVILECPRCLTLFAASTRTSTQVAERLWGARCRCGNVVEFDLDYMDQVQLSAQPHVADRIRNIGNYRIGVEGFIYERTSRPHL